jgi:predicted permease
MEKLLEEISFDAGKARRREAGHRRRLRRCAAGRTGEERRPVALRAVTAMLERIAGIVFPIYAVVAIGYAYGRWKKPDMAFANQLNMDIFVPALVFAALASKSFDIGENLPLLLGATVVVLGSGLLAWPVARLLGVATNTFVPPMMFKNSGNMGLPLMVLAFGEAALPRRRGAVLLFENFLHYSLGTWMLDHQARLCNLWRVPVIAAALAGLA